MKTLSPVLVAAALLVTPTSALAANNAGENITACKTEIVKSFSVDADALDIDFKKMYGTSRRQMYSFVIKQNGERDIVKCKVSRDGAVEIQWGDVVTPVQSQLVKAEEKTSSGE